MWISYRRLVPFFFAVLRIAATKISMVSKFDSSLAPASKRLWLVCDWCGKSAGKKGDFEGAIQYFAGQRRRHRILKFKNFILVLNASPVSDKKTPKLGAKTEKLIFKLRLSFPSSFSRIIYCAKDKLCLHSKWIFWKFRGAIVFVAASCADIVCKGQKQASFRGMWRCPKTYQPSSMQSWRPGSVWKGLPAPLRFDTKTRRPQVRPLYIMLLFPH